jgi:hypothetical protein
LVARAITEERMTMMTDTTTAASLDTPASDPTQLTDEEIATVGGGLTLTWLLLEGLIMGYQLARIQ